MTEEQEGDMAAFGGGWVFPQPEAGERALHAWVVDGCPYVLLVLATEAGEEYHVHLAGYHPDGSMDAWSAASPGPWPELHARLGDALVRLAAAWYGRVRQAGLSGAADWRAPLAAAFAGGILQVTEADEEQAA